jgi:hypothetical protein
LALGEFVDEAEWRSIGLDCELSKEVHSLWRDRDCEIFPEAAVLVLPAQIYRVPTSKRTIIAIDFKQYPCILVAIGVVQLDCCTAEGCKTGLARPLEKFITKPLFFSFVLKFVLCEPAADCVEDSSSHVIDGGSKGYWAVSSVELPLDCPSQPSSQCYPILSKPQHQVS